jgi:hypothetical protein
MDISYSDINKVVLIGGCTVLRRSASYLRANTKLDIVVFTTERYLEELVPDISLKEALEQEGIKYIKIENINIDERLCHGVTPKTLGIAMGSWEFEQETVKKFSKYHLLDFMTIDLPRYKGGAHHTWRILHQNISGCVNLQVIHGGKETFQQGEIIKRTEFTFPFELNTPEQTIAYSVKKEIAFFSDFFDELSSGKNFTCKVLDEEKSSYYPFLHTKTQGLINWAWSGKDISLFISAFDEPYPGASTFLQGKRVIMKDCELLLEEDTYHPFTSGIVIRKDNVGLYIATVGHALHVKNVENEAGESILSSIELGSRFHTPQQELDKALSFEAVYGVKGLKT